TLLTAYLRFLAPPAAGGVGTTAGEEIFTSVGCALCHTASLTTARSSWPALSDQKVQLYSDLLVHRMGSALADGIVEGTAGPDEFRTAPLWGLGQRLFLLHDGRTRDIREAILAHADDHKTR